ncbi:MAG: putative manganese-dependent inorganic diphosphatase [Pseudobutyrivibrio sp.]|nr:putative manganese-dependent inorganic diphosphatase [Pseudobutyrivibrio sp.]
MAKNVYVIGHKNPDTDSVCAAISYAYLKNSISEDETVFIPMKAGQLNEETRYVLQRFGVEEPETITDVGAQLGDVEYRKMEGVDGHISLKAAWELMKTRNVATLPVVASSGKLEGVIVNGDITYSYMDVYDNGILGRARTPYRNIIDTLNGTMITGNDHAYFVKGNVVVAANNMESLKNDIHMDDLVIVGNSSSYQMACIELGASCLIVCGSARVDYDVVDMAKLKQCVIISTDYDTFTVSRLIHQSMCIRQFMTKEKLICFDEDDFIDDIKEVMKKVRHRDFPVLDENRRYIGMMSRRMLLNMQKKQVILVDHNERSQAVDGIDQAEVLEIVDHHRLGSLETVSPIFFRNVPCGCTSTIITAMYHERGVEIPKEIAGLLCSAILSDTLMFRSPTCTTRDETTAKELAEIAEVDFKELATAMFEAGSDFKQKTSEQIFYQDYKTFVSDDIKFGVAQVSAVSRGQLDAIKSELKEYMNTVMASSAVDVIYVMLTDILDQDTELMYLGNDAGRIIEEAFHVKPKGDSFILHGVVSRKKQLVPPIMESMQN